MRVAILSDIHANREAFDACLALVRHHAPDETVLLGDLVGYGPDPAYAVEQAAELVDRGALCIMGNHDEAVVLGRRDMTENARIAIDWTRGQLSSTHVEFLARLPMSAQSGDRLYVHASAHHPAKWPYVRDCDTAAQCLAASGAGLIFCGHTHVPAMYYQLPGRRPVHFQPHDNIAAPLSALRRHLVVAGSVGQPRDGNPQACFALLDTRRRSVTQVRVGYDHEATAAKIDAAGLPSWLGMRLKIGR